MRVSIFTAFKRMHIFVPAAVMMVTSINLVILFPTEVSAEARIGRIVYTDTSSTNQIYTIDSNGANKRAITTKGGYEPAWSPMKDRIAFIRAGDLFVMRFDGANEVRLTRDKFTDADPTWSPDGTKIAFSSYRNNQSDIYSISAAGGTALPLTSTTDNEFDPDWSPDGSQIVYGKSLGGTNSGIAVIPAVGGSGTVLYTNNNGVGDPAWSPDGAQIAWRKFDWADWHIMVDNTPLVTSSASLNSPAWSTDGTSLVYATTEFGISVIKFSDGGLLATNASQPDWGTSGEYPVYKYSPVLRLHENENYWPMSAGVYARNSALKFSHSGCTPDTVEAPAGTLDPFRLGLTGPAYTENLYTIFSCSKIDRKNLFSTTDLTRPYQSGRDPDLRDRDGYFIDPGETWRQPNSNQFDDNAPAYFDFKSGEYIAYWFFSPRSIPGEGVTPGIELPQHDGDWEHVVVMLNNDNTPSAMRFYYHHNMTEWPWESLEIDRWGSTQHPTVYAARNGHGSYWTSECGGIPVTNPVGPGTIPSLDTCSSNGPIWDTSNNLENVTAQPWYGFGGAWGQVGGSGDRTAPLGPGPLKNPLAEG